MSASNNRIQKIVSEEEKERYLQDFEGGPKFIKIPAPENEKSGRGYWAPGREDEQLRLTGSHFALKELYGGNFQPEVEDFISFEKGADCLHIYCGAGAFITDMAVDYPNSNFVGVDLTISSNIMFRLPNVTLLPGNVTQGLDFPDSSFDFINIRVAGTILKVSEWPNALKEAYRLLRPGGCIAFFEFEPRESGGESCERIYKAIIKYMENHDQDPLAGQNLAERLVNSGFEHIKTETTMIDCGLENGRSKRWMWMWSELLAIMGPYLCPLLDVKSEDWPEFITTHAKNMEDTHGEITAIRVLARKPLN